MGRHHEGGAVNLSGIGDKIMRGSRRGLAFEEEDQTVEKERKTAN